MSVSSEKYDGCPSVVLLEIMLWDFPFLFMDSPFVNSPPPKPEAIPTNFFAESTVLLVPITSRAWTER
jgi:hypothetical protein